MSTSANTSPQVVDEETLPTAFRRCSPRRKLTRASGANSPPNGGVCRTTCAHVFLRREDDIFRTYFTAARGLETVGGVWSFLDLTPLGRQEQWEDSPARCFPIDTLKVDRSFEGASA